MAGKPCHYDTLGLRRDAATGEVKKAYRKMALYWHPDKNPGNREEATEMFRLVSEAYEVLGDPEKRRYYDTYGHDDGESASQQAAGAGGTGDGYGNASSQWQHQQQHNAFHNHAMGGMRDPFEMFESFFGTGARAGRGGFFGGQGGFSGMMGSMFADDPFFSGGVGSGGGGGGRADTGGGGGFGVPFAGNGFMTNPGNNFFGGGGFGNFSTMSSSSSGGGGMGGGVSSSTSSSTTIGPDGVRRTVTRTERTVIRPDGTRETKVEEFVDGRPVAPAQSLANG